MAGDEPEAGPMPPPPGADVEEAEEDADVGPTLPKAKKRKVGAHWCRQACGGSRETASSGSSATAAAATARRHAAYCFGQQKVQLGPVHLPSMLQHDAGAAGCAP